VALDALALVHIIHLVFEGILTPVYRTGRHHFVPPVVAEVAEILFVRGRTDLNVNQVQVLGAKHLLRFKELSLKLFNSLFQFNFSLRLFLFLIKSVQNVLGHLLHRELIIERVLVINS
jgi:hypothetical protein